MKRISKLFVPALTLSVLALGLAVGQATAGLPLASTAAAIHAVPAKLKPKKRPLPKPACPAATAVLHGNSVTLGGTCRLKGRAVATAVKWNNLSVLDASGNPLPLALTSGKGRSVPVQIAGANSLSVTAVLSTPKAKTHQAATGRSAGVTLSLGGYTAVGTPVPLDLAVDATNPYSYCSWTKVLDAADGSPTVQGSNSLLCSPAMGAMNQATGCHWQALPPQAPHDYTGRDGDVSPTGLTVYGNQVVCAKGYTVVPQLWVRFAYYDPTTDLLTDSCELPLAGVTSFTVPPTWGGSISFWADLLTFGPDNRLYNANQDTTSTAYQVRTGGTVNVCQAYGLPPIHTEPFTTGTPKFG